jgi:spore germination cell wall hydrolase CwlJ-like protein
VRAIIGEAANQGELGMVAVGNVIRNRGHLRGLYGLRNPMVDKQPAWVWRQAERAWAQSATNDVVHGATHFENVKAFGRPRWAAGMRVTVVIKDHTFYK